MNPSANVRCSQNLRLSPWTEICEKNPQETKQYVACTTMYGVRLTVLALTVAIIDALNTERSTLVYTFWLPRNLSNHRDRQRRTADTVLVKSREMTSMGVKHFHGGWERRGKDGKKQNTLAPLAAILW